MRDGAMFGKRRQLQIEDNVYIDKTTYKEEGTRSVQCYGGIYPRPGGKID